MRKSLLLLALLVVTGCTTHDQLAEGFRNPPDSARPHTWWHWMNGNVTKEGITADLEAMHRVGVGGAQIFNVSENIPHGNAPFMSDNWHQMIAHATREADRLNLELCIHNCAGWSSSGGPWVTPDHAMQFLTTSQTHIHGPAHFSGQLPQPATKLDFYRDVAVLAFPSTGDAGSLASYSPKITTNVGGIDLSNLINNNQSTPIRLPKPTADKHDYITIELSRPMKVETATIALGRPRIDVAGQLLSSDDGQTFQTVQKFHVSRTGARSVTISLADNPPTARFYRFAFMSSSAAQIQLASVDLSSFRQLDNVRAKAGYGVDFLFTESNDGKSPADALHLKDLHNLTANLSPDGTLTWDAPQGDWTIYRIGYTPTGMQNHPSPPEGLGLECDKLSAQALDAHWHSFMDKVLADAGGTKSLRDCLIDSYEVGGQNWTPKMTEEFKRLRGYDPTPYLPVVAGRIVESPEISERFLWDLRRTVSDLFAENYYGHFAELCHQHGLIASIEPYTGPYESLQNGGPADIPMGEFWTGSQGEASIKVASSVGHIYGKNIIATESFTAAPPAHGRWQEDLSTNKALGDLIYCQGINRFIVHRFAMQPWLDKYPGMTMGQWGFMFDRTNTWFEQSRAWIAYLTRCQYLLQQGRFVADCALFCGETAPVESRAPYAAVPRGYDHDQINAEQILKATVKDGRITLPDGMSYAVLVLPAGDNLMTPTLIKKLRDLASSGATIVGAKPARSPSLTNYPECDGEVREVADSMWTGKSAAVGQRMEGRRVDASELTEHHFGNGMVSTSTRLDQVLDKLNLAPDFSFQSLYSGGNLVYIHRQKSDVDIYFVSNQRQSFDRVECTFRVAGKIPQLWHADTGQIEEVPVYREENGRTTIPIYFDPAGSVFVVFRPGQRDHATNVAFASIVTPAQPTTLTVHRAVYEATDGAGARDVTATVIGLVQDNALSFEAGNDSLGGDPFPNHTKRLRIEYSLNGKRGEAIYAEHDAVNLPAGVTNPAPGAMLTSTKDGTPVVIAHHLSTFTFQSTTGKKLEVTVPAVPDPIDLSGDWTITFPKNWGAPPSMAMPALASWTENADDGVKYFSGTATYHKTVNIPANLLGENKLLYLDLGKVKNVAEVKLNGKDLGILWKPPFRVEITDSAHAGDNLLEVAITNNWPNRLIGDERTKAPDVQWDGIHLANWPQWLLDGKPSPTGRLTFTTWHHWTADMQLLESGLLGPVKLDPAVRVVAK